MAVDQILRTSLLNEPTETFKSPVTKILPVVDMAGRGMGHHHVDRAFAPDFESQTEEQFSHRGLGILVGAAVVPHGPFKSQNI